MDARQRKDTIMKRTIVAAMAVMAIALATLAGCAGGSQRTTMLEPPYGLSGSVTMGEYLQKYVADYDEYATGLDSGSHPADKLEVFSAEDVSGSVTDQELIKRAFDTLSQVRIDVDHPAEDVAILDGDISFSFEWDGRVIYFDFLTTEYATFSDGKMYLVEDPGTVGALLGVLRNELDEAGATTDDAAAHQGSSYQWDADGDGTYERLDIDFVDQGDEAPSMMQLTLYGGGSVVAKGWIDSAYEIQMVITGRDDRGTYAQVHYLAGDHYRHDLEAVCTLRLVDGEIVTTYEDEA